MVERNASPKSEVSFSASLNELLKGRRDTTGNVATKFLELRARCCFHNRMETEREISEKPKDQSRPNKLSLGQAIDQIVEALKAVEAAERSTVLLAVCAHLKIPLQISNTDASQPALQAAVLGDRRSEREAPLKGAQGNMDIRSLKEQKQPENARQMACVVAFYLQEVAPENEKKPTVSTADLQKYFKQAGFPLPTKLPDVLNRSKEAGYFDSADRGEYRLTPVGYNLVAHNLPKSKVG
jgi:hypothetical protein